MIPLYAPDFMRKLKLAIRHAGYKNLAQIALEMNVKEPTLRSWTKAHTGRVEGSVSKKGREPVIRFFCAHLPHLSEQAVTELLEGPYEDMAAAFLKQSRFGLAEFIDREAAFGDVKLIIEPEEPSSAMQKNRLAQQSIKGLAGSRDSFMVTIEKGPKINPTESVPTGRSFRFEFPRARRAKYFLGLQQASQGWAAIPAAPVERGKTVYMPAALVTENPITMREDHVPGPSRFTLIQSMQPFPEFIQSSLLDSIPLSRTDCDFLKRHLQDLPKNDRTLTAMDIRFTRDSGGDLHETLLKILSEKRT
jgi:hypothetical protein